MEGGLSPSFCLTLRLLSSVMLCVDPISRCFLGDPAVFSPRPVYPEEVRRSMPWLHIVIIALLKRQPSVSKHDDNRNK